MWFCSECGKQNIGKFCTRCGTKHVEIEETAVVSESKEQPYGMMVDDHSERVGKEDRFDDLDITSVFSASALFRRDSNEEIPAFRSYLSEKEKVEEEIVEMETEPFILEENFIEDSPVAAEEIPEETPMVAEEIPEVPPRKFTPVFFEEEDVDASRWSAPFLHENALTEKENGSVDFIRNDTAVGAAEALSEDGPSGIDGIFSHRKPPENDADREWKFSKRVLIGVGAVGGVVCMAFLILVISLLVNFSRGQEELPVSTGIYYYVSGVKDFTPLYADKSINSDVLAELENGDPVEFLVETNARFTYVYHEESEQYGYVKAAHLVEKKSDVDDGTVENKYANEKSLGYFYVTKVEEYLTLWENPDGGGVVKAKLENGFKVSLLEKTNDKYWYVFDYNSAERGYVRTAYLTDSLSKVVGLYKEPKDKTVIGDFYVKGVKNYLPIYSKPKTGGDVRGKLNNGDKVGLIQKTNGSYWYVSGGGVYGWVSAKYLIQTPPETPEEETPKEETPAPEPPTPEPAPEPTPAPAPSNDYKVTNTQDYLPVLKDPQAGAAELGKVYNGDTVTLIREHDAQFWYVKIPSLGIEGYVSKNYLTK